MRRWSLIAGLVLALLVIGAVSIAVLPILHLGPRLDLTKTPQTANSYDPAQHGLPGTLAGYKVLAVLTPDNTICLGSNRKRLILQTTQPNVTSFLNQSDANTIHTALEQLGLTQSTNWDWEIVSSDITTHTIADQIEKWNQDMKQLGFCLTTSPLMYATTTP